VTLFTIGYEDATPARLVEALRGAGVTTLVDVRALANSRKPGFAKTALSAVLAEAGIGYRHVKALGTRPRGGQRCGPGGRRRCGGSSAPIWRASRRRRPWRRWLMRRDAETICLLCLEADPARCHRTLVAEAVAATSGVAVTHLHPA
jgi:uncharacterized protein (DUF488 family)